MFIILIYKLPQVALAVKNPPANEADIRNSDSIPGLGRSSGEGNGNTLQYSGLRNLMDRGPGEQQSMKSQRVRHDLATKQPPQDIHIEHQ